MLVSIITPTYNRREFFKQLVKMFLSQTYPQEQMEWIIADDGTDKIKDLLPEQDNIKYFEFINKKTLGEKRNFLNKQCKGEIIICMDDDDYYSPDRVEYCVKILTNSKLNLAGSTKLYIYYSVYDAIFTINSNIKNGTMAYKKYYLQDHCYANNIRYNEEYKFTHAFTEKFEELDSILCIAHPKNTCNREHLIKSTNYKLTELTLNDFNINEEFIEFYKSLDNNKLKITYLN